jgi:hypothetical protein
METAEKAIPKQKTCGTTSSSLFTLNKRSTVMKHASVFKSGLIAIVALVLMVGLAMGQNNLVLSGGTVTNSGTIRVNGNITNTAPTTVGGIVELKGSGAQGIGTGGNGALTFSTLRATNTSAKTFNVAATVSTNINLTTAGATQFILATGQTLTLTGTITNTGGGGSPYDFTASGATVDYALNGAQTVFATTYDVLTASAGGTKSLGGNVTTTSDLNVSAGDLSIGANTLTVNGSYDITGAGAVTGGATSNLTLNGSGDLAAFEVANGLQNFTLNRAANTVTLSNNLDVVGAFLISAGVLAVDVNTLTLSGSVTGPASSITSAATGTVDYAVGSQNVIASNYGNLTFTAGDKTLPAAGTVGIAGTFTPGGGTHVVTNSTVDFNGTTQSIPAFSFHNLLTSNSGTKTAGGAITIANNFDNGGGSDNNVTLTMGGNTLTLGGGSSDNTGATIQFAGAANGLLFTTGTIEYNGDITQTIAGGGNYNNLTLSTTTTSIKNILAGVTVGTSSNLTLPSGVTLALTGTSQLNLLATSNLTVSTGATLNNAGVIEVGP